MATSEDDLDLLETYLDDEMSVADVSRLRARLVSEPELAASLSECRSARAIRKAVFASMEMPGSGAARVLKSVKDSARRDYFRSRVSVYTRYVGAAAACIVIGFTTGWLGRSGAPGPRMGFENDFGGAGNISNTTPVNSSFGRPSVGGMGGFGGIPSTPGGGAFSVTVTDETGHVVAVKRFNTYEEAQRFSDEISAWQNQRKSPRDGVILPGAAEQF